MRFIVLAVALVLSGQSSPLEIGDTFTLRSDVLGEVRRINVYTPPQSSEASGQPLPVLYMPDGGIGEDFLHVAGLVQVSVMNGTMRPFLLVGIENTERRRDLTGPTENAEDKKIAPRVGGSAAFRRFLRTELMPAITARYKTTSEKAIVGESLAGLFVVETFLLEPDLFDTYIAFDPSLWWNDSRLVKNAPAILRDLPVKRATVFLASGKEATAMTRAFSEVLREHGPKDASLFFAAMPAETHATIYHPAALRAFRQVFGRSKR
jgi:uncharacterized protein